MRALVQRVKRASVTAEDRVVGEIGHGLLVLLGICNGDTLSEVQWVAEKCSNLRIFEDDDGKMNRSLLDVGGEMLVVSQFTLYGDCRKGRRPSFIEAAPPEISEPLYEAFASHVKGLGVGVSTGRFGAHMSVELTNDGPVTVLVEKRRGDQ